MYPGYIKFNHDFVGQVIDKAFCENDREWYFLVENCNPPNKSNFISVLAKHAIPLTTNEFEGEMEAKYKANAVENVG